jgi:pre-60S factor REI1
LAAVSEHQYDAEQETIHPPKKSDDKKKTEIASYDAETISDAMMAHASVAEDEVSENVPVTRCLFCNLDSLTLNANIDHMSSVHGLFIPSPEQLPDMESFLGYLAVIIFEYKECLYCGLEKGTVDGVQTHMRDKGHCMIKMDATSELLDFWELSDSENDGENEDVDRTKTAATKLSETEMRLPSGAVINSRSDSTQLRARPGLEQSRTRSSQHRARRDEKRAITVSDDSDRADDHHNRPSRSNDRRIAVRGEMGLIGVPENQLRALQVSEKKMKRREAVAKAAYRHAMEGQPVKTMYYKVSHD